LCADSKAFYDTYRPYSLIDGEVIAAEGTSEADDDVPSQSSAPDLMFGDEGKPTDSK
jgi:hypothetical protein